jgi:O-antigen ligase
MGRLLRFTIGAIVVLIPVALVRGWLLHGLAVGPETRWLSAAANLALLLAGVWCIQLARAGILRVSALGLAALMSSFVILTIANGHRSVWLATVASILGFVLFARPSPRAVIRMGLITVATIIVAVGFAQLADLSISQYFTERVTAFTDFAEDPNASWRVFLWLQALDRLRAQPIIGLGFGEHFGFVGPAGDLITTSPHNFYVTLAYHAGLVGLVLFLTFVLRLIRRLLVERKHSSHPAERIVFETQVVTLAAVLAYFIAYPAEFSTWLFSGLILSYLQLRYEASPDGASWAYSDTPTMSSPQWKTR